MSPLHNRKDPLLNQQTLQSSQLSLRPQEKMSIAIIPLPDTACGEPEGVDGDGGKVLLCGSEG